ncbi:MAG: hypothetical protein IJP33_01090, partial [Firmicutes bacterium]|nr:hypothetical protein [Bacillota bacterium]
MDDVLFTYSARICAKRVTILKEKLLYYRLHHAESQTAGMTKTPLSVVESLLALKTWIDERGYFE